MTEARAIALVVMLGASTAMAAASRANGGPHATGTPAGHDAERAVPDAMPGWRVVDIDGRTWSPDALRGRVVLVDFWATWCAPCLADLPGLKRLHARYGPQGLTILGISLDRTSMRDFRSWLQRHGILWPQVREAGGYDGATARHFGVDAIPASFLYDRSGQLLGTALRGAALEARVAAAMEPR